MMLRDVHYIQDMQYAVNTWRTKRDILHPPYRSMPPAMIGKTVLPACQTIKENFRNDSNGLTSELKCAGLATPFKSSVTLLPLLPFVPVGITPSMLVPSLLNSRRGVCIPTWRIIVTSSLRIVSTIVCALLPTS